MLFEHLLQKIAQTFEAADLPYMVIGGQAVLLYGEPRLTRDIDVTLGVAPEALPTVLDLAEQIGLVPLVEPESFVRETMVLPCADSETDVRVDLIFSFSPYEQQAMQRVRRVELGKTAVRFASPEDVIVHKVVAGRPRDLEDVKNVLGKQPELDAPYIRRWLREYTAATGEPLLRRFERLLEESH